MAYFVLNGAILEATIRYEVAGQVCLNIGHFSLSGASSSGIEQYPALQSFLGLWDAGDTGVSSVLAEAVTTEVKIREVVAQWVFPTRYARLAQQTERLLGTVAPPTTPGNLDLVVVKHTETPGRHGTGGIHISGLPTDGMTADRWATAVQNDCYDYAQAFTSAVTLSGGATLTPIIYKRTDPSSSPEVKFITVSSIPRTMRRRGLGLGI